MSTDLQPLAYPLDPSTYPWAHSPKNSRNASTLYTTRVPPRRRVWLEVSYQDVKSSPILSSCVSNCLVSNLLGPPSVGLLVASFTLVHTSTSYTWPGDSLISSERQLADRCQAPNKQRNGCIFNRIIRSCLSILTVTQSGF